MIHKILSNKRKKNNQKVNLLWTTFICSCGNTHSAWQKDINYGSVKSCGCLVKKNHYKTHGMCGTKTYQVWINMKRRCDDKNAPYYKNYGGRGINYCTRWKSFEKFYTDMGDCPEAKTLDRIDTNKQYCKENCRWTTQKEQMRNIRKNVFIFYKGKKRTIAECAELSGLNTKMLSKRLKRGWSDYDTMNTPSQRNGSKRK